MSRFDLVDRWVRWVFVDPLHDKLDRAVLFLREGVPAIRVFLYCSAEVPGLGECTLETGFEGVYCGAAE